MALYGIGDLKVEISPVYDALENRAAPFLLQENTKADISVKTTDEQLAALAKACGFGKDMAEYQQSCVCFCEEIIKHQGFVLHASAVKTKEGCFLFSAPSGVGKSTHAAIWQRLFNAEIINDDKPTVRQTEEGIIAYGTPWCGSGFVRKNDKAPVKALYFIRRAKDNRAFRLDNDKAVYLMLESMYRPTETENMDKLCATLDAFVKNVPVFGLECDISDAAANTAFDAWRALQ